MKLSFEMIGMITVSIIAVYGVIFHDQIKKNHILDGVWFLSVITVILFTIKKL